MNLIDQIEPATLNAPKLDVRECEVVFVNPINCESTLQIGLFFDGTGNNRARDRDDFSDSNVARLYDAYPNQRQRGTVAVYVPGVGTRFDEIGEQGESWQGAAYAKGCEARVLYGLLTVLEELYRHAISNKALYTRAQRIILCTKADEISKKESQLLAPLGFGLGLAEDASGQLRRAFLSAQSTRLKTELDCRVRPTVKQITIDVLGFSRGAAEARVFCSWLSEVLVDGRLAGIPLTIRFLGLFDTVASAGFGSAVVGTALNQTHGHEGWASVDALRIAEPVRNCVHMVAMHEFRKNFPLDEAGTAGVLPFGVCQIAYPGSHSDVGGGYAPGALGVSVGSSVIEGDSLKLSQIPLCHMFDCAVTCGVPLNKTLASEGRNGVDAFAISPRLATDFGIFLSKIRTSPNRLHHWGRDYLSWRWHLRHHFKTLQHVTRANQSDRQLLLGANDRLIRDSELLLVLADPLKARAHRDGVLRGFFSAHDRKNMQQDPYVSGFDPEARTVLDDARSQPFSSELGYFFDHYVHDSYAGFSAQLKEGTGYWRYRKAFQGTDKVIFADESRAFGTGASIGA